MILFKSLRVSDLFECNGEIYLKVSNTTAVRIANRQTYHFRDSDRCSI